MSVSNSSTVTSSYTVADVAKVVRSIEADLVMIASSTGAVSENKAREYAHDIELLAKSDYLAKVDLTLISASENEVKALTYLFITENASSSARPGGVMWPSTPSGRLRVILSYTDKYRAQREQAKKLPLKIKWSPSYDDTSHSSLSSSGSRGYSSNGFGANRNDYS